MKTFLIGLVVITGLAFGAIQHERAVGHYRYTQGCVTGVKGVIQGVNAMGIAITGPDPKDWCETQYKDLK